MEIGTERDAREFVASWVAAEGRVRPGILAATVEGLTRSLAIMDGAPSRYAGSEREDMRGALRYLSDAVGCGLAGAGTAGYVYARHEHYAGGGCEWVGRPVTYAEHERGRKCPNGCPASYTVLQVNR